MNRTIQHKSGPNFSAGSVPRRCICQRASANSRRIQKSFMNYICVCVSHVCWSTGTTQKHKRQLLSNESRRNINEAATSVLFREVTTGMQRARNEKPGKLLRVGGSSGSSIPPSTAAVLTINRHLSSPLSDLPALHHYSKSVFCHLPPSLFAVALESCLVTVKSLIALLLISSHSAG